MFDDECLEMVFNHLLHIMNISTCAGSIDTKLPAYSSLQVQNKMNTIIQYSLFISDIIKRFQG